MVSPGTALAPLSICQIGSCPTDNVTRKAIVAGATNIPGVAGELLVCVPAVRQGLTGYPPVRWSGSLPSWPASVLAYADAEADDAGRTTAPGTVLDVLPSAE